MNSPLFVFLAAKEFFENGTLYASKYFKTDKKGDIKPFDNNIHAKICVPATNISFSLELVFKAFLMQSGKPKSGHDLVKLYMSISNELKSEILEHYKSHNTYKNYVAIRLQESDLQEHGKIEKFYHPIPDEDFVPIMLESHKLAFINFRYMHEFKVSEQWLFYFKEFSNYTFSALTVLGKTLNLKVVSTIKEEDVSKK